MSTRRRVSMGERSAQGVAGYHRAETDSADQSNHTDHEDHGMKPPVNKPRVTKAAPRPAAAAAGSQRMSIYWRTATLEEARSAYMADSETQPDGPTSFARWIDRAVAKHARLSQERRTAVAAKLGKQGGDENIPRSFQVQASTIEAMRAAIKSDRAPGAAAQTRSDFVADAVRQAVHEARGRWGQDLPPVPERGLPNRRWD